MMNQLYIKFFKEPIQSYNSKTCGFAGLDDFLEFLNERFHWSPTLGFSHLEMSYLDVLLSRPRYIKDTTSLVEFLGKPSSFPSVLYITGKLFGGKGGFGSMLKSQKGRRFGRKKAANYDSCRDLSGRRIRAIKQEKEIAEWLGRAGERKRKKDEELIRRIEDLSDGNKKKIFKNNAYITQSREILDKTDDALANILGISSEDESLEDENSENESSEDEGLENESSENESLENESSEGESLEDENSEDENSKDENSKDKNSNEPYTSASRMNAKTSKLENCKDLSSISFQQP